MCGPLSGQATQTGHSAAGAVGGTDGWAGGGDGKGATSDGEGAGGGTGGWPGGGDGKGAMSNGKEREEAWAGGRAAVTTREPCEAAAGLRLREWG